VRYDRRDMRPPSFIAVTLHGNIYDFYSLIQTYIYCKLIAYPV